MHEVRLPGSCTLAWEPLMSGPHGGVESPFPQGGAGKGSGADEQTLDA
jgi:hypothetical protein